MFDQLEILSMARGLATHAARRHDVVARNLAQADTPGYKAQDISDFSESWREAGGAGLRATRAGHLGGREAGLRLEPFTERGIDGDPNGNTVSVESQMVKSAETQMQHEMALTVYKTTLGLMRAPLGRG